MRKLTWLAAAALLLGAPAAEAAMLETFSYKPENAQSAYTWGTGRLETYDVAIHWDDPEMVGRRLSVFETQFSASGCEDCYVWISSKLRTKTVDGVTVNDPDYVYNYYGKPCCGTVSKILDDTFIIPEGGFYIGFTFTVKEIKNFLDEEPVVVFDGTNPDGFFVHTSQTYTQWTNMSSRTGKVAGISFNAWQRENGTVQVGLSMLPPTYAKAKDKVTVSGTLLNPSKTQIKTVGYGWRVGDTPAVQHVPNGSGSINVNSSEEMIPVTFTMEAPEKAGMENAMLYIGKVNDDNCVSADRLQTFPFVVCDQTYERNPLIEEYTGTWCGNCPAGAAAIDHIVADNPDAIAVSYHDGDPMALEASMPASVTGFPDCYVDRVSRVKVGYKDMADAYAGRDALSSMCRLTPQAAWSADGSAIECNLDIEIGAPLKQTDLRPVYLLVADGLTGAEGEWAQVNYLSGKAEYATADPYAQTWVDAPELVSDAVYNGVVVYSPSYRGQAGTLPSTISSGDKFNDSLTIPAAKVVNKKGVSLLQPQAQLRLVTLLYDGKTQTVVNAASVPVSGSSSIGANVADNDVNAVYYDLMGRRVHNPAAGTVVVKVQNGKAVKMVK